MDSSCLSQTKIFNHLDRVQEWLENGTCFPVTIEIDPTNLCTRNCPACAGNRYAKNVKLSLSFMKDVIRQIKPFCKGLIFTGGGEPLCSPDTLPAMEYARKCGIVLALVTNADLIDQEVAKRIVQNCTYVRASYNDDKIWENLELLVKARNAISNKCTIGIAMLTSRRSAPLMKNFAIKAKKTGVDYAQFRPYHLDTFDAMPIIKKLQNEFNSKSFQVIVSEYKYTDMKGKLKKKGKYEICFADNFRTVIAADGKMYPDCWTRNMKDFCIGDLRKNSFKEIWKSGRRKKILMSKLKHRKCPPMCYHDPLSELLWDIWLENKQGKHLNFV